MAAALRLGRLCAQRSRCKLLGHLGTLPVVRSLHVVPTPTPQVGLSELPWVIRCCGSASGVYLFHVFVGRLSDHAGSQDLVLGYMYSGPHLAACRWRLKMALLGSRSCRSVVIAFNAGLEIGLENLGSVDSPRSTTPVLTASCVALHPYLAQPLAVTQGRQMQALRMQKHCCARLRTTELSKFRALLSIQLAAATR